MKFMGEPKTENKTGNGVDLRLQRLECHVRNFVFYSLGGGGNEHDIY